MFFIASLMIANAVNACPNHKPKVNLVVTSLYNTPYGYNEFKPMPSMSNVMVPSKYSFEYKEVFK